MNKGTPILSLARRGSRKVEASARVKLAAALAKHGMHAMKALTCANDITIGKAVDGMPIQERSAQRLEDWAQAYELPPSIQP